MSVPLFWHRLSCHDKSPARWFDLMEGSRPQASALTEAVWHAFLPLLAQLCETEPCAAVNTSPCFW